MLSECVGVDVCGGIGGGGGGRRGMRGVQAHVCLCTECQIGECDRYGTGTDTAHANRGVPNGQSMLTYVYTECQGYKYSHVLQVPTHLLLK